MARPRLADVRVIGRAYGGGEPHAPALVQHRVVHVVLAGPDDFAAPVERRLRHAGPGGWLRSGIAHRKRHPARRVTRGIEDGQVVRAQLQRAVDLPVRVDRGIAPVGRDFVVEIGLRVGPVPLADHDVALDAAWPGWRRRHFPGGDPVGPVGEHRERAVSAELVHGGEHRAAGLSRLEAAVPCGYGGRERAQCRGDLPRSLAAQLVTGPAPARLHDPEPLGLTFHVRRHRVRVTRGRGELARRGDVHQGKPVTGGIVLRRRAWRGGRDGGQVHGLSRSRRHLGRVDQAVAAHPHSVRRLGKVGYQVASLVVGHDDADELRGQVAGLGDHPDARFRPVRAGDHTADVIGVDASCLGGEGGGTETGDETNHYGDAAASNRPHVSSIVVLTLLTPLCPFVVPHPLTPSPFGRGGTRGRPSFPLSGTERGTGGEDYTHARYRSFTSGTRIPSGVSHTAWLKISTSIGPAYPARSTAARMRHSSITPSPIIPRFIKTSCTGTSQSETWNPTSRPAARASWSYNSGSHQT